ncbi:MAG: FAD-binding protein [Gemmatimonadetes bacterium]|nr:FAD-binding protein [Gemmatimonadota bacterium]
MTAKAALKDPVTEGLRALLGERFSTAANVCEQHGRDESYHTPHAPDAVAFARSTADAAAIVKICARHKRPVIPFGAGTSLEGHVAALHGGVSIDLSGMKEVIEVNAEDMDCRVEAGVTRRQLNDHLRDTGLFFPVDPGAEATFGGMAATRASGTNAVRYGTMAENVLGLTVVLADGRVINTGGRARKSAAGYDLTRLFVGSEGTLGVITEIGLRLHGIPEAISSAVCPFKDLEGAVNAVIATIQMGVPVARVEFLDEVQIDAVNRYSKLDCPVAPTLFFEFHGSDRGVKEQAETVGALIEDFGGGPFDWASGTEERNRLWQARADAYYAALALRPGAKGWATDVCVPISSLARCIVETRREIDEAGLLAPIVGHVGDGNFHVIFILDPLDEAEMAKAIAVNESMLARALAMGGTSTGEHGIGHGKIDALIAEHGEAVAVMAALKRALDPDNIMNPGKVLRIN